ncbi:MAG: FGGY-family carbohydrate kinase [Desulfobacteraceae bacterium]|nr:FGGY-family carbohydrate kinase [Desulfobacteraceae bacterium]
MKPDLLLAIDNGTQSLKALVFDTAGIMRARRQVVFEPYRSDRPGWAEQDPEVFWQALCTACRQLWSQHPELKARIAAVALTTQRGTVVNVDETGRPIRSAILWLDQRKARNLKPLGGAWGLLFRLAGLSKTMAYFQGEAEANWIRTVQPEVWRRTHKFLLLSGYLTFRLVNAFVDSTACQVGYIPFDYKRLKWAADGNWRWRVLPVTRGMLPELIAPGKPLGAICREAARATGIPEGLPLIAAAADKACEVIGSGSLDPCVGCLSYGTTATINVTHRRYVEPIPLLPSYPSAVPGYYSVEVQVFRGYWMVSWFKEEFGWPERQQASENGQDPELLFERFLESIPACSMGLVLQPYWTPGLKCPGPEAKGAIIGFGDIHSRAHLYRSILEGIAFALREGKERIERRSGVAITSLRVSGGGSRSDNALQLTADVFGLPTTRPHLYETSGLGAAINAAVGAGLHPDFPTAVEAMTRVGDVFEPDSGNHRLYDALYRQVYKKMYRRLRPLYEKIREITGYPT